MIFKYFDIDLLCIS